MVIRIILLTFMTLFVIGCGGGGDNKNNTSTQKENINTQKNTKTISGYVIDDPVVGATIEVYDLNGTLLKREENATDKNGKYKITVNKVSEKYFIKVFQGKINEKLFDGNLYTKLSTTICSILFFFYQSSI